MLNNILRPWRPDRTDAAARPGPRRKRDADTHPKRSRAARQSRRLHPARSSPAIAAATPCAQVRRDPSAAGGDGEEPRMHPRMP
ncbi:hypothetical protein NDU88_009775 [Pleurodeles waltl]|uniref:Uncharacterized protein n=1 Tax=Pleurodeles waltl TaxID=8319 RepID=A0AAV7RZZ8_PLEWA|nr:hypothetical protein NDU88_009775 [Pleurodeles waltl]